MVRFIFSRDLHRDNRVDDLKNGGADQRKEKGGVLLCNIQTIETDGEVYLVQIVIEIDVY